ncbi:hypothetical protein GCM10010232_48780 [Streptomyces amakusaensis]
MPSRLPASHPSSPVLASPGSAGSVECPHQPRCPAAADADRDAARTVASHPEQGWSRLCNGVLLFEDLGELLPAGGVIAPRRAAFAGVAA